jgi:hypothetical protein
MHISFQQGQADLAHRGIHIAFGQFSPAFQGIEYFIQPFGQVFKHNLVQSINTETADDKVRELSAIRKLAF